MKRSKLFRLAFSAAALSLSICTSLHARAQSVTDDQVLATITQPVAASDGSVIFLDDAGQPLVLAYGIAGYTKYYVGDVVDVSTPALCQEQRGRLSACVPIASDPGEPTGFWCGNDGIDSWCECDAGVDCIDMLANGPCPDLDTWACDDIGCVCEA